MQEKDRLKKEMLYKLRETKANLLKMTDNQVDCHPPLITLIASN